MATTRTVGGDLARWPEGETPRTTARPAALVLAAIGGPREVAGKLRRLARTARLWLDRDEIDRRLRALRDAGHVDRPPTRLQLVFGGLDMVRFLIDPGARDYYRHRGISFGFHQVLRALDDPTSILDPTGIFSDRDVIIGHLMQVVHLDPVFDLQLMSMFEGGLDELERQVAAMVDGTHPRAGTIGAVVEEPDYHERLLDYVRRFRVDPATEKMPRRGQSLRADPGFAAAERAFATLPGYLAWCHALPRSPARLVARLLRVREFPVAAASAQGAEPPGGPR